VRGHGQFLTRLFGFRPTSHRAALAAIVALVGDIVTVATAEAHGFGQRYDLPIPLAFYIVGAGLTVAFSFVLVALFFTAERVPRDYPHLLLHVPAHGWISRLTLVVRAACAAYFLFLIVAGIAGDQNPFRNIIVVSVWIIGWVGISLACAFLGDVWRLIDPWSTIFAGLERLYASMRAGRVLGANRRYPKLLAAWPAVVLFVGFAWMELIWSGRDVPARLAQAMLLYSLLTWTGMFLFGRDVWRAHGEVFSIAFGIFARFGILAARPQASAIELRPPAVGLLAHVPEEKACPGRDPGWEPVFRKGHAQLKDSRNALEASMTALVVALLAAVTFDGFLETPLWAQIDLRILDAPTDSALWTVLGLSENGALRLGRTIGLIAFVALFNAVYQAICALIAAMTGRTRADVPTIAGSFVLSLVPISLAYHIAHYFSYLLIGGQYIIPALSDPLGRGLDLFGTADYRPDIGVVSPWLQWSVAVVAVVVGHLIAVALAHVTALRFYGSRRLALLSQIPMLVLMVGYTMLSLWILSQPIVETASAG
jgi:hypothetical protein